MFFATRAVLKTGECHRMFPSIWQRNIQSRDWLRQIARERKYLMDYIACRTGVIFLRILGKQRRKRGEREASAKREWRARGGALKNPACPHTIVSAVPAFIYERGYPIGYLTSRDLRTFLKFNMAVSVDDAISGSPTFISECAGC